MKDKKYICIKDLQGGNFAVNSIDTADNWKSRALEWCQNDNNEELYRDLKQQPKKNIIDFISEIWELEFSEINEKEIDFLSNLLEDLEENSMEIDKFYDYKTMRYLEDKDYYYLKGKISTIEKIIDMFYENLQNGGVKK